MIKTRYGLMTSIERQDVLNMLLFDTQYTGLDNRLLTLVGHDKDENILFGVSKNGKAILKSTTDHLARFVAVPEDEWVKAKTKSNTVLTKMLENSLAIADANMNPQSPHTVTADNSGTEWGGKSKLF